MHHKSEAWERLNSEELADLKLFKVCIDEVRNPKNGKIARVTVLSGNDSVTVMAVTPGGNAVLVDNYRFGTASYVLELPGGMVDEGEDHQEAARRELLEETGYAAETWYYAGCVASNPVFMNSFVHHYLAINARKIQEADLDDEEDIRVREMPLEEVGKMLSDGLFLHPHTVSGVLRTMEVLKRMDE